MKKILTIVSAALLLAACDTQVEKLEIQHIKTFSLDEADMSDEDLAYYENIREWKKSKHTIS